MEKSVEIEEKKVNKKTPTNWCLAGDTIRKERSDGIASLRASHATANCMKYNLLSGEERRSCKNRVNKKTPISWCLAGETRFVRNEVTE